MNCENIKAIIAKAFDENQIENMPERIRQHLQHCEACAQYFQELQKLQEGIEDLKHASFPAPRYPLSGLPKHRKRANMINFSGRLAVAIGAFLVIAILFGLLKFNKTKRPAENLIANPQVEMKIALIDNREANVVFLQSESNSRITMVWLY